MSRTMALKPTWISDITNVLPAVRPRRQTTLLREGSTKTSSTKKEGGLPGKNRSDRTPRYRRNQTKHQIIGQQR